MRSRMRPTPRGGFTLVELLVVIAIIAILFSLLLAGLGRVRLKARETQTHNDIRALDESISSFKGKFGFVPPSHIVETATNGTRYLRQFRVPTRIDMPEYQILRRMYPRWDPVSQGGLAPDNVTILPAFQPARAGEVLDNNQAMVYFLGGPQNTGWSPAGPTAPSATGNTKIPPFFEFKMEQLVSNGTTMPRFVDPNNIPYAYFSGNPENDRYDPRSHFPWLAGGTQTFAWSASPVEVAPQVFNPATATTYPTRIAHPLRHPGNPPGSNTGKWLAPGRWQIIAAGKDSRFGVGSPILTLSPPPGQDGIADYMPEQGDYISTLPGDDDLSNFHGVTLGTR